MQQTLLTLTDPQPTPQDPDRDFLLYVEMDLKPTLDRKDVLAPIKVPEGSDITTAFIAEAFAQFAKKLRPVFEKATTFTLVLSGEVVTNDKRPPRFINLWDIGLPNEIPRMMEALALDEEKSQLYGHLDYLVERESQDLLRVFPSRKVALGKPAEGNKLYYVILEQKPQTVDLYAFKIDFSAYSEPMPKAGIKATLIASSIANTGVLNRIIQFWGIEVDQTANQWIDKIVPELFSSLPWRGARYNPQAPVILNPTSWDVLYDVAGVVT